MSKVFFTIIILALFVFGQKPVLYRAAFVDFVTLTQADTIKANPTLAAGDVQISIDGGAFANLTTIPDVYPATTKQVRIRVAAAEAAGKRLTIVFSDQTASKDWDDITLHYYTYGNDTAFVSYYPVDVKKIGATTITSNLAKFSNLFRTFTIDTTTFVPTRTVFETTLSDTIKNWYLGRYILFESTATDCAYQKAQILQYRIVGGKARISCTGLTSRPYHGYAGVLLP